MATPGFVEKLVRKYETPRRPYALSGPGGVKRHYPDIPEEVIKEALAHSDAYTLHKEFKKPRVCNPYYIYEKREQVQMDLIDVRDGSAANDGINWLLCAIDCFTRKAWIVGMERKTAKASQEAIRSIVDGMGEKPKLLFFDHGGEFQNRVVANYLASVQIPFAFPSSDKKAVFVERFNGSIQNLIYRYLTANQTLRYIDVLDRILAVYNSRGHRSIKYICPNDAEKEENKQLIFDAVNEHYYKINKKRKEPKYSVGEQVIVKKLPGRFDRGYKERWRKELFQVVEIKKNQPMPMYILKSLDTDEVVKGGFYAEEIQSYRVKDDVYKVERVIRERTRNGQRQLFVAWVGFGPQHNSWIPATNVTRVYNNQPAT